MEAERGRLADLLRRFMGIVACALRAMSEQPPPCTNHNKKVIGCVGAHCDEPPGPTPSGGELGMNFFGS